MVFAAGNGVSGTRVACDFAATLTSPTAGPSWVVTVGAASPANGQEYCWHSIPADVTSMGDGWKAADYQTMDGERSFQGTSSATPLVTGVIADQILQARRAFGDTIEGPHGAGALAVAEATAVLPSSGPLADGVLTSNEVEDAVLKTAQPPYSFEQSCAPNPGSPGWIDPGKYSECVRTTPTTPAYFLLMGYGIVTRHTRDIAREVLLGERPMPDRSEIDAWVGLRDAASDAIWNNI